MKEQHKEFLSTNNILFDYKSHFRTKNTTTAAALKVMNYLIDSLDKKQHCAAPFIDTVDHAVLVIGLKTM